METKERLVAFLRKEHKAMNLPDDFGASNEGGNPVYNWSLPSDESDITRTVELRLYPNENVIKITASVSPKDFRKKYKENAKVIAVARFDDLSKTRVWVENHLRKAGEFARESLLLDVGFADAMPGTYRNVL